MLTERIVILGRGDLTEKSGNYVCANPIPFDLTIHDFGENAREVLSASSLVAFLDDKRFFILKNRAGGCGLYINKNSAAKMWEIRFSNRTHIVVQGKDITGVTDGLNAAGFDHAKIVSITLLPWEEI